LRKKKKSAGRDANRALFYWRKLEAAGDVKSTHSWQYGLATGSAGASMDISWVTERIGLGGGIWNARNMEELVQAGVTHVVNMQIEFDDRPLAQPHGVKVLWNPTDDDFLPKPAELLERGVGFALSALEEPQARVYVHCAAGVHRAPMMTLAVLCALEWEIEAAMVLIETRRPVVDFADVYVESVRRYLEAR
jgi:protein-tyrosine phosphatase